MITEKLNNINQLTETYIQNGELAGTVTLVAHKGDIVHLESRGKLNLESGADMLTDAIFRIYSMTKPITSVAAMMLYERGAFDLATPISTFIPEFKNVEVYVSGTIDHYKTVKPEREITMRDLLMHTSGLTYDYTNLSVVDESYRKHGINAFNNTYPLSEFVKRVAKAPILFTPGTNYNYGVSTDVLGHIIEIISGMPLDKFFKKEIFAPLEMVDTDFYVRKEKQPRFTTHYLQQTAVTNQKSLMMYDHPETGTFSQKPVMLSGGGGLTSTANDYLKFASMLLNNGIANNQQLLRADTIKQMTINQFPTDLANYRFFKNTGANMPGYGFGYGLAMNLTSGEYGWSGAANTYFIVDPKAELIAMFLTQLFPFDLTQQMVQNFKQRVYDAVA